MVVLVLLSFLLLAVFNIICISRYGLLSCFSAYGRKWLDWTESHPAWRNANPWSVITIITALLVVPPMLETSVGSPIQFVCFFCPLYLLFVGLTPHYDVSKKAHIIHNAGVYLSVIMAIIWLTLIYKQLLLVAPIFVLGLAIALCTRTLKQSWLYYIEMIGYVSVYTILLTYFIK